MYTQLQSVNVFFLHRCTCGNCQRMPTERECRCCKEVQRVAEKAMEEPETDCITDHQGFKTVCLDKYVLEVAWYQYRQQYGHNAFEGPVDQKWRHIAYRQLARWCWGFLGKDVRVVLPSCAVSCIRAHFLPPGLEENAQFHGFQDISLLTFTIQTVNHKVLVGHVLLGNSKNNVM